MERLPRASLRPVARPVDTFARPFQNGVTPPSNTNPLLELANSLKAVEPQLNQFLQGKQQEFIDKEVRQAKADRLRVQKSFADAIKANDIEPGQSPYYVKEFKRLDGELSARNEYMFILNNAINESGIEAGAYETEAQAAQAYSELIGQTRANFLSRGGNTNDLDFLEGFEAARASIENSLGNRFLQNRIEANEERFNEAVGAQIATIMNSGADTQTKAQLISEFGKRQIGQFGMSGTDFNRLTVDAINTQALSLAAIGAFEEADEVIDLVSTIEAGPGRNLGGTRYAQEQKAAVALRLVQLQRQQVEYGRSSQRWQWSLEDRDLQRNGLEFQERQRNRTEQNWAEDEIREERTAELMADIFRNPTKDFTDDFDALAADPDLVELIEPLQRFQDSRITATYRAVEDPLEVTTLNADIFALKSGPKEILDLVEQRKLSLPNAARMLDDWQQARIANERMGGMSSNLRTVINDAARSTQRIIESNPDNLSPLIVANAEMAKAKVRLLMAQFVLDNPDIGEIELLREAEQIKQLVINSGVFNDEFEVPDGSIAPPPEYRYNAQNDRRDLTTPDNTISDDIQYPIPTPNDIEDLKQNPALREQFELKFGPGSADQSLSGE